MTVMEEEVYAHRPLETWPLGEGPGSVRRQNRERAGHGLEPLFGFHRKGWERQGGSGEQV